MSHNAMYIGRYAPSPTGPLHFGSLVTAVASYLDARAHDGQWLLRIEDLDTPRIEAGAADAIQLVLDAYGFEWDGTIMFQSQRSSAYHEILQRLKQQQWVYPCHCSRKDIAHIAHVGLDGPVYPGTCRHNLHVKHQATAWRIKAEAEQLVFHDRIYGTIVHRLKHDIGDYILQRRDGLFAYQLAVVVDDAEQGITHIVRGADLLNSTTRQIYLQYLLNLPTPHYAHIPLVLNKHGEKLSKQTQAEAITSVHASLNLLHAYRFLGLPTADLSPADSLDDIWRYGIQHWRKHPVINTKNRIWLSASESKKE